MNIHPAIVAAAIMGSVLLSGQGKMNLIHHEVFPDALADQQIVDRHRGLFVDSVDIRLPGEIKGIETVRDVIKVLQDAKAGDVIRFHMTGVGGEVETVEAIINNIHASKAHVIMIVEGPVYSGHAYLSLNGDELIVLPYAYLMLHTSSAYGHDCTAETGVDRTVSNAEHCTGFMDAHLALINKIIAELPVLTPEEKVRVMTGHDVYLTADDVNKRSKK